MKHIELYAHLCSKTTFEHKESMNKHIELFSTWCVANQDAIIDRDVNTLTTDDIRYSKNVFVNVRDIFEAIKDDIDATHIIWTHVTTIAAIVDQTGAVKLALREMKATPNGSGREGDFLGSIISKIEGEVGAESNPLVAVQSLMTSGVMTEIMADMGKGMEDGSFDVGKLLGSVQGMMAGAGNETTGTPDMMGLLAGLGGGGDIMGLLGGGGGANPGIMSILGKIGNDTESPLESLD